MAQAEALYRQYRAKKEVLQGKTKEQVMERYGNAAEKANEEVLALAQSENYVEYNAQVSPRCGRPLSPAFKPQLALLHIRQGWCMFALLDETVAAVLLHSQSLRRVWGVLVAGAGDQG